MPGKRMAPIRAISSTPRESPKAVAAFAEYCALGPTRSLRKLHETLEADDGKTAVNLRQLEYWSSRYGWVERVKQYDLDAIADRELQRQRERERMDERHAQIGTVAQRQALEQIERLIRAEKFGSQATVMLLKLATDLERAARGAPSAVVQQQVTGRDGGPIEHEHIVLAAGQLEHKLAAVLARSGESALPAAADESSDE